MLVHWSGDRSHHRAAGGTVDAVRTGLLDGMLFTGDQAVPLRDELLQIEGGGPGDLLPVRGAEQRGFILAARVPVDQRVKQDVCHGQDLDALTGLPSVSKKRPAQKSSAS